MHSHHSHSGLYVSHAVDSLDDIVERAHHMGFEQFCLTEHMPRLTNELLYPEEEQKQLSPQKLLEIFDQYQQHARSLQNQYQGKGMEILVGYESEGVDGPHINLAQCYRHKFDMVVGSVHHVFGIPIDFSKELWHQAKFMSADKTARSLYKAYFDLQYKVIKTLKPDVIGHIDLIRLYCPGDELDPTTGKLLKDIDIEHDWPEVWTQIIENIQLASENNGLFELNSAAIRKGWHTPYPQLDIAKAILKYGNGKFCLSDDSHGLSQIGLNYHKVWHYIEDVLQLEYIYYLTKQQHQTNTVVDKVIVACKSVKELKHSKFWDQYK